MGYTFGTSDVAASRLENIAQIFNPLAAEFIRQHIKTAIDIALDLGCGPGFTTDMLSVVTRASKTYGIDTSDHFIELAAKKFQDYTFIHHDVTKIPFPVQADVMYSRFLLSHLSNAIELINLWIQELRPGGVLFIEELEDIHTESETFKEYLNIAAGLVASQGASLYVGKILAQGNYEATVLTNEQIFLPVANSQAATWFFPNTTTIWENERFVLENTAVEERKNISTELLRIKESCDQNRDITWKMRRLAMKK